MTLTAVLVVPTLDVEACVPLTPGSGGGLADRGDVDPQITVLATKQKQLLEAIRQARKSWQHHIVLDFDHATVAGGT